MKVKARGKSGRDALAPPGGTSLRQVRSPVRVYWGDVLGHRPEGGQPSQFKLLYIYIYKEEDSSHNLSLPPSPSPLLKGEVGRIEREA
eukprot:scaffold19134_cov89-Isochrysis_galbana.AAC.1